MHSSPKMLLRAFSVVLLLSILIPFSYSGTEVVDQFAELPVQHGGRLKPMDTLARNTLLIISSKQTARLPSGQKIPAIIWLIEVMMQPEVAHHYPVFRVDSAEVLGLLGKEQGQKKYFSYNDLIPHFPKIVIEANKANPEAQLRSAFERSIVKLYDSIGLYHKLLVTIHPGGVPDKLTETYAQWAAVIIPGMEAIQNQGAGEPFDSNALQTFIGLADKYLSLAQSSEIGIAPTEKGDHWSNVGQLLLEASFTQKLNPILTGYAEVIEAYRAGDFQGMSDSLVTLNEELNPAGVATKMGLEVLFNKTQPFYRSIQTYVLCFILILLSWLFKSNTLQRLGFTMLVFSFAIHTIGIIARMYIQGRPPVTNLYSSAIFVGWGAVLLSIFLERVYKNGLGSAVAALIGFSTLIIAHNLAVSGDTLEMMRAVLDSNFWLSTHVIVVTLGYSAMFLAGALAMLSIIKGSFGGSRDVKEFSKMIYGIIAFATLFSFVGTMLGGVWADQSWGRFWGWDPKENGALLIVLWCAVMLHARWGKLVKERGFLIMAVMGNVVTSWSWFGVNMLGVGLHSYGFMDAAFWALFIFVLSQIAIIILGYLRLSPKN